MRTFYPFLFVLLLLLTACYGGSGDSGYAVPVYVGPGIGLGTVIAVVVSWSRNKSILWAIIHGFLGWIYVIYALLVPKK
ncbi:MAG TPA: hypothetical protein VGO21_03715 [Candidatus Paceibacterota bacterium]|nr:hypothetical protein [Candidatus Paceibacterota bacterium]